MLQTGETYTDPRGDDFTRRDPERTRKRLVTQLRTPRLHRHAAEARPGSRTRFLYSESETHGQVEVGVSGYGRTLARRIGTGERSAKMSTRVDASMRLGRS